MPFLDLIVLALIQGITEFLPISSSAHLRLWPILTGNPYQGLSLDVAVHLGTLAAVMLYFRGDVGRLFVGAGHILTNRPTPERKLAWLIVIATIPAVVLGLALKLSGALEMLDTDPVLAMKVIGWTTILGGIALWLGDRFGGELRRSEGWSLRDAIIMGLAQAVALIPGVSRSGACMTLGRALGFERAEAARIAMLMAVPTILAAGAVETLSLLKDGDLTLGADFAIGAGLSFLAAMVALKVMFGMFRANWTMTPFVLYRLGLGAVLLALAYT